MLPNKSLLARIEVLATVPPTRLRTQSCRQLRAGDEIPAMRHG
jgi:hypothetical protein